MANSDTLSKMADEVLERVGEGADARGQPRANVLRFAGALLAVALMAAAFAIAFRWSLSFCFWHVAHARDVVAAMQRAPTWMRVVLPALGGLGAGVISAILARSARGHGVGDVMEAVVLGRIRLSLGATSLKSLASWFAIVSGGSLGREGPLIQFGGAAGKAVADRLGLGLPDARRLIAAGTAAGFAAAYNTPFAAALFVLEVVAGVMVLDTLVPVLVAAAVAAETTRLVVGTGPIYGQRAFALTTPLELLAFAGLGALGAVAAQGFMRVLSWGERHFHSSRFKLPWRPALGGLLAGAVVAIVPEVAGNGYEPLNDILDGRISLGLVAALSIAKMAATTASVSSGSPGGVFTPTLLLGGCLGFVYGGTLATALGVSVGPAAGYALVGMAATTAATTHAPLMAAVMAFELSGDYAVVLPLTLATAVAAAISRKLRPDSIYTAELRGRGIRWELTLEGRRLEPRSAKASSPSEPPR